VGLYISQNTHSVSRRNYPLSQQVSLSLGRSGHAQLKQINRATETGHILHSKFISRHPKASPEASSPKPSKHAYRSKIQQEI
jgi:hypothetical protein